ncbi:porin family protein [uncultured Muribaculum sp.]|uniref:type IX secretion/gliding motility protein PorT/SprT n=1 Tax=uncultured Muribaculum sp. TaxID=1918613 RepID=UPI00263B8CE4|nr:porin family protein [uncultured Muribaculum sp.]
MIGHGEKYSIPDAKLLSVGRLRFVVTFLVMAISGFMATLGAQHLNDKLMNKPYADLRRWHLGFSVGVHTQDMSFTHNGFVTDNGEQWFMEQPSFSPGFCVNGLVDFRLSTYFNLRFTPGMYFGNRDITMREYKSGKTLSQNIKSAYLVMPLDLKFSGLRYRNSRPYVTGGVMPTFNVSRQKHDYLRMNVADFYLTCGFGCDFYLPYFKFNPEVKFCFGLTDVIDHNRTDLVDDPEKFKITQSLKKATSKMVVLTFYFE